MAYLHLLIDGTEVLGLYYRYKSRFDISLTQIERFVRTKLIDIPAPRRRCQETYDAILTDEISRHCCDAFLISSTALDYFHLKPWPVLKELVQLIARRCLSLLRYCVSGHIITSIAARSYFKREVALTLPTVPNERRSAGAVTSAFSEMLKDLNSAFRLNKDGKWHYPPADVKTAFWKLSMVLEANLADLRRDAEGAEGADGLSDVFGSMHIE